MDNFENRHRTLSIYVLYQNNYDSYSFVVYTRTIRIIIIGPVGKKTSAESVITLIAGCFGLLYGRGLGHVLHGRSPKPVPLYHVGLALIANGLSLLLCSTTTNDITKLLPYFGFFGITFGKLKISIIIIIMAKKTNMY